MHLPSVTIIATALAVSACSAFGINWDVRCEAGLVTVLKMHTALLTHGDSKGAPDGIADYTCTRTGRGFFACHYGYEGNNGGEWDEQRSTETEFKRHGCQQLSKTDLGDVMVFPWNHEAAVFATTVNTGDTGRFCCNKYTTSCFTLLNGGN